MKLKAITTTLLSLGLAVSTFAQDANTRNPNTYEPGRRSQNVYFEILGPGITYSFNYDTRFQNTLNGLGGRVGISYVSVDNVSMLTVPIGVNYLLGKKGNYFEMGAGATFVHANAKDEQEGDTDGVFFLDGGSASNVLGNLTFGYRRQPVDGGFSFRAGFSPVFGSGDFIPYWPYIGFGYSF